MRRLAAVALLVLALPAGGAARTSGGTSVALVATTAGHRLLMVDVWTAKVLAAAPLPATGESVATTFDAKRVLVASPGARAVTLVDMRRARVLATFRGIDNPADVEISPNGLRGFVLEKDGGTLTVLDLARRRVAGRVAVGARPNRLAVSDNRVWVAHESNVETLTVVEARPGAKPVVVAQLPAGGAVRTLRHVPDSAWLVVTYWHSGDVAKLDAGIGARVVFRRRAGARVSAIGIAWLTTDLWVADRGGRMAVLSSRTGAPLRTVRAGAPVRRIEGMGSYMAAATPRDVRVFLPGGRRMATSRVPAGINGADFAVVP
jgi:hypothetical protein